MPDGPASRRAEAAKGVHPKPFRRPEDKDKTWLFTSIS
jgi:hypothetical protein